MIDSEGLDLDTPMLCGKGQKELESIPVSPDSMRAYPFYVGEILIEKLMDTRRELHMTSSWLLAKSINPAR